MRFLLALAVSLLVSNTYAQDITDSDSGIFGPKYADLEIFLSELEAAQPWIAERIVYGKTVEGRNLNALKIKAKQYNVAGAPLILIAGSIHGNEYLNLGDRLAYWFLYEGLQTSEVQNYINAGGEILVVPVINPDGYEARVRENANGIDLNRDFDNIKANFKGFTQPETTALAQLIQNEVSSQSLRLAVTVDYHCCSGDMLYPYSYRGPVMPEADMQRYLKVRDIVQFIFGDKIGFGTTPTLLGYDAIGTSKDYYYETYGSLSFTFEGRFRKEDKYLNDHIALWRNILVGTLAGEL